MGPERSGVASQLRILIVEDDAATAEAMAASLRKEGFETLVEGDGARALEVWREHPDIELVILDMILPGLDGLGICRQIRETSDVPILMLTGQVDPANVVVALELGADDYVRKPFDLIELKARIRALLRRSRVAEEEEQIVVGSLVVDPSGGRVTKGGEEVSLSATEFKLLLELVKSRGKVLSRDMLLRTVWNHDYLGDSRLVDMAIKRLREKIEDDPAAPVRISTVRGLGYRFEAA